jgi:parallel beta-helix repeat protein
MELGIAKGVSAPPRLIVGLAAAMAVLLAGFVPAADAALQCGDTITANKKLKKNLLNCPDDGITIGAAGVKLDLNGHKITGVSADNTVGVHALAADAVIKGAGSVRNFDENIRISSSDGSVVRKVDVRGGDEGITVTESSGVIVKQNKIRDYRADGISILNDSDIALVERNRITGPDESDISNTAIAVAGGDDHVLRENTLIGTEESTAGVIVRLSALRTQVLSNQASGFTGQGIHLYEGAAQTLLKGNVLQRNGWGIKVSNIASPPIATEIEKNVTDNNDINGIELETNGSTLKKNTANGNGVWGILSTGISIDHGGNKASGNGQSEQCSGVACS